ncbi:hypothetical protein ACE6H2_023246 [Prunus campanulata]
MLGLIKINFCVLALKLSLKVCPVFSSCFWQVSVTFWLWSKNKSCSTHCPDHVGISLDWWFEDFLVTGISLDTHVLLGRVAARGHFLGDPFGPKMIPMSSRARRYARI